MCFFVLQRFEMQFVDKMFWITLDLLLLHEKMLLKVLTDLFTVSLHTLTLWTYFILIYCYQWSFDSSDNICFNVSLHGNAYIFHFLGFGSTILFVVSNGLRFIVLQIIIRKLRINVCLKWIEVWSWMVIIEELNILLL